MNLDYKLIGKEAVTLGEALCISAVYLGIGALVYRGCTSRLPGEEKDKVNVQQQYEPVNILEIPLQ